MGSGRWSPNTYQQRAVKRQQQGRDVFAYSRGASEVHPSLNPYGLEVRESRDSDDSPSSNAIVVGLDVTGSMGQAVRNIHKDLPNLLNLLLDRKYIQYPHIMFSAFSNGSCDRVPVQVGQFEADNRMDENLENMIIGGRLAGGCDVRESAELMVYLAARHTSIDCWEKRKKKGYVFLITDEMAYESVSAKQIEGIFGRDIGKSIPLKQMVEEASEKYHVYVIVPTETGSGRQERVHQHFRTFFDPQHVILLENSDDISETIALAIGLTEGNISLAEGLAHLKEGGATNDTVNSLSKSLRLLDTGAVKGKGGLGNNNDDDDGSHGGTRRL